VASIYNFENTILKISQFLSSLLRTTLASNNFTADCAGPLSALCVAVHLDAVACTESVASC